MALPTVTQKDFDEAVAMIQTVLRTADRQLNISRTSVAAIVDSLELMRQGKTDHARQRLETTLEVIEKMMGGDNRQAQ